MVLWFVWNSEKAGESLFDYYFKLHVFEAYHHPGFIRLHKETGTLAEPERQVYTSSARLPPYSGLQRRIPECITGFQKQLRPGPVLAVERRAEVFLFL